MAKVATIITYNDIETIEECIGSIENKVDRIIAVDGKFIDFPGDQEISTDGTLTVLGDHPKVETFILGGLSEVAKRNYPFNFVKDWDVILSIDADEILEGTIPELNTDIGLIDIFEFGDRRRHRRYNRFFRYRDGLHYSGKHYLILDKDKQVFTTLENESIYTNRKITEFRLIHKSRFRSAKRTLDKNKYYKILQQREAKIDATAKLS